MGKTIRVYLAEGTPTGILVAESLNWSGKIIVSPRSNLALLAKYNETKCTGIYCLVGADPEDELIRNRVYIGESDNVINRLAQHDSADSKDFWTRTIVVTSKDGALTKSHVRFLESRLLQMATDAGRVKIDNHTAPPTPMLPETDVADMEEFLGQIQMILPVLGFGFFQPKPSFTAETQSKMQSPPTFIIESVGVNARAREIDGEFVVMKGSTARKQGVHSWNAYKVLRDSLISEGKLIKTENPDILRFAEDIPFNSPSAAAVIVLARNANGRTEWKDVSTGKTYAEWQEDQINAAVMDNADPC